MRACRWSTIAIAVTAFALRPHHRDRLVPPHAPVRFATFNIEDFPKDARQIAAAFDDIEQLDASFIALQEINDPPVLVAAAHQRLGASWQFVHEDALDRDLTDYAPHYVGVLFDTRAWTFVAMRIHDDTRLGGRHKPALEVRLRNVLDGTGMRVIVVHFRSGTPGRETRIDQHAALRRIVERVKAEGERVVVLGDFNATEDADRTDLDRLAETTGLVWATRDLACSAYWAREDGCPSSRLDHVLTWDTPASVVAAGECARSGCEWQDRCPIYRDQVSDHCPVVVTIP